MIDTVLRVATWVLHRMQDGLAARKGVVWSADRRTASHITKLQS